MDVRERMSLSSTHFGAFSTFPRGEASLLLCSKRERGFQPDARTKTALQAKGLFPSNFTRSQRSESLFFLGKKVKENPCSFPAAKNSRSVEGLPFCACLPFSRALFEALSLSPAEERARLRFRRNSLRSRGGQNEKGARARRKRKPSFPSE